MLISNAGRLRREEDWPELSFGANHDSKLCNCWRLLPNEFPSANNIVDLKAILIDQVCKSLFFRQELLFLVFG